MRRLNAWLGEHLWATILLSVVAATVVITLFSPGRPWWEVLLRVAGISAAGAGVVYARRRKEKRVTGGSDRTVVTLEEKLRRGEVPEDADERQAMARLVAHRQHATRHGKWALAGMFVLLGLVAVGVAVTADPPVAVGYAVFSAVFLGWLTWNAVRQKRRLRRMAEAVPDPAGADPDAGPAGARPRTRPVTRTTARERLS
ncbi:hypothetical protein [Streptomyces ficellus]|uniref:Transmembrane protein n=1 Tax=Streptomyces ficellus TaxID=1977088 RepID=A0A6I6FMN5_9ACTN|nr:hypothetical protein [Streptomyces ficellus]QGV80339.1 hypothetical protein EIZ62_20450 [Streptomyces ficellus]